MTTITVQNNEAKIERGALNRSANINNMSYQINADILYLYEFGKEISYLKISEGITVNGVELTLENANDVLSLFFADGDTSALDAVNSRLDLLESRNKIYEIPLMVAGTNRYGAFNVSVSGDTQNFISEYLYIKQSSNSLFEIFSDFIDQGIAGSVSVEISVADIEEAPGINGYIIAKTIRDADDNVTIDYIDRPASGTSLTFTLEEMTRIEVSHIEIDLSHRVAHKIRWTNATGDGLWATRGNWVNHDKGYVLDDASILADDLEIILPTIQQDLVNQGFTQIVGNNVYGDLPLEEVAYTPYTVRDNVYPQINSIADIGTVKTSNKLCDTITICPGVPFKTGTVLANNLVDKFKISVSYTGFEPSRGTVSFITKLMQGMTSYDYYMNTLPSVYFYDFDIENNNIVCKTINSNVGLDDSFAVNIPNMYGAAKAPSQLYYRFGANADLDKVLFGTQPAIYTFIGNLINESATLNIPIGAMNDLVEIPNKLFAPIKVSDLLAQQFNGQPVFSEIWVFNTETTSTLLVNNAIINDYFTKYSSANPPAADLLVKPGCVVIGKLAQGLSAVVEIVEDDIVSLVNY